MSGTKDLNNSVYLTTREMIVKPPKIKKQYKLMDRFVITQKLGDGSVCSVYLARDELTGSKVALKVANMNCSLSMARLIHEKRIYDSLEDLSHITKCFGLHQTEIGHVSIMFLAIEYSSSGSLHDWLIKYNDDHEYRLKYGWETFRQCAKAAASLNMQGYVCNDLSPANFVKIRNEWKLTDLGLVSSDLKKIRCNVGPGMWGTPLFMSPEAYHVTSFDELTIRSDIYSMTTILFQMLSPDANPPFYAETFDQLEQLHCHRRAPLLTCVDTFLAEIMVKGLSKDPSDRYESIEQMLSDIESKGKKESPHESSKTCFELGQAEYQKGDYVKAEICLNKVSEDWEGHGDARSLLNDIALRYAQVSDMLPDILCLTQDQSDLSGALDLYQQCNEIYPNCPALRPVEAKLNVKRKRTDRLLESFTCAFKASDFRGAERCLDALEVIDRESEHTSGARRIMYIIGDILDETNSSMDISESTHDYSQLLVVREQYNQIVKSMVAGTNIKQMEEKLDLLSRSLL